MKRSRTYYNLPGLLEETERAMKASSPLDTTPCHGRLCSTDVTDDSSDHQQQSLSSSFPPTLRPCELLFRKRRRQHSGGRDEGDVSPPFSESPPYPTPLEPEPLSPLLSDSWGWIPLSPVPDEHACGLMMMGVEPCGYEQGTSGASVTPLHSLEGEGDGDDDTTQATSASTSAAPSSWFLPSSASPSCSSASPPPFRALSAFAACHVLPRALSTPALSCASLHSSSTLTTSVSILSSIGSVSSTSLAPLSASTSHIHLAGLDSSSPDTRVSHTDLTRLTHDLDHLRLHRHFSSACDMASMGQVGEASSLVGGVVPLPLPRQLSEGRTTDKPRCAPLPPPLCLPPPASPPVITAAAAAPAPLASGGWERGGLAMGSCSPSLVQRKHRMAMPPRDCRVPMPPLMLDHHRRHRACVWDAPVGAAECK